MDTEKRKQELKQAILTLRKNPTRCKAQITEDNNRDAFVVAHCPHCHGCGKYDTISTLVVRCCADAPKMRAHNGTGVAPEIEPFFNNDKEPVPVAAIVEGWINCSHYGCRFTITDNHPWTGLLHMRFRQILHVKKAK